MGRTGLRLHLLLLASVFCILLRPTSPALSSEDDYRLVFSDGLAWPESEMTPLYYSARKYAAVGDFRQANALFASLERKLARAQAADAAAGEYHLASTIGVAARPGMARLQAVVLARRAELEALASASPETTLEERRAAAAKEAELLGQALTVCVAGGEGLHCDSAWVGWGVGSCCSIAGTLARALQRRGDIAGTRGDVKRALMLGRRLTSLGGGTGAAVWKGPGERKRVVLLTAVSGAYHVFVAPLIASARRFLLLGIADLEFVVVSDQALDAETRIGLGGARVTWIARPELGWPLTAMMRYRSFLDAWHLVGHADYAFLIDVDCLFVAPVGEEILGRTVGTTHADNAFYSGEEVSGPGNRTAPPTPHLPKASMWRQSEVADAATRARGDVGFRPGEAVYERRGGSAAAIPEGGGERYYYSGFLGGNIAGMREVLEGVVQSTESDLARGVVARVHDESHVNRYWSLHPPAIILTAAYMYPEAGMLHDPALCRPALFCPRDHMHPWLWAPWRPQEWDVGAGWWPGLWGSKPRFVPRILNLAKDKAKLVGGAAGSTGGGNRYVLWNADLHIGPIGDVGEVMRALGVDVREESLSAHCASRGTCATSLKVLSRENAMELGDNPKLDDTAGMAATRDLQARVFEAYISGGGPADADLIMCAHPAALCEAFIPFNRALVVYLTTRLDLGRLHRTAALQRWLDTLGQIATRADGAIVANNHYDAAYLDYFTGIRARVIPTLARHRTSPRACPPPRSEVLIDACDPTRCPPFRQQGVASLISSLREAQTKRRGQAEGYTLVELREVYPRYQSRDLERHLAIVYLPYQVSVMALFERLAAGIPVFAPSLDLLVEWHMRFGLVFERRADWQTAGQRRGSLVGPHPNASAALRDHDPNDERDPAAVRYWLGLSDIYTTPGVLLFNSWEHLLDLLREVDLCEVSRGLLEEQGTREEEVHSAWKEVLSEVVGGALPGGRPLPRGTFQDAMRELYPSLAL